MDDPKSLSDLSHTPELTEQLIKLSKYKNFSNLLIYGPSGSGRHTRIRCLLNDFFGTSNVHQLQIERREFKINSKVIQVNIARSYYHIEITPSNYNVHDRVIIQDIIKDIAESPGISMLLGNKIKVIVIDQADLLTMHAQQSLRRTMEVYAQTCRFVLCCENISKIIPPLRSRTLAIRVPLPTLSELRVILNDPSWTCTDTNIRKAKLMKQSGVTKIEWEEFVKGIAKMVQKKDSILKIRDKFYQLLSVGVPDYIIFRTLIQELLRLHPERHDVILNHGANYQHRSVMGQKPIYHLEAFVSSLN